MLRSRGIGDGSVEASALALAQDLVDRRDLAAIDAGAEHVFTQLPRRALVSRQPEAVAHVDTEGLRQEGVVLGVAPLLGQAERCDAVQLGESALRGREQDLVDLRVLRPPAGGAPRLADD